MVEFVANVSQVRTATGGGFRLSVDIPEANISEAAALLGLYLKNVRIRITDEND